MGGRMSAEHAHQVMSAYFDALGTGRFRQCFTEDVTWTTVEDDLRIRGASAVESAIVSLHSHMPDLETRRLVTAEGAAYLEGSCAAQDGGRVPYCVAYDIAGDRIAAMRAYGAIASFMNAGA